MPVKAALDQLAIFGGPPAFAEPLHVGRPNVGDRQALLRRLNDLLDRRWLTNDGPYVRELERTLERLLGVAHCVAMSNGTAALELTIRALGLTNEVIVPSFTFVATAHALQWQGIRPVFCDIDPATHTLDAARVEELISPRTTGILGVHLWGRACDVAALEEMARRHRLTLLFDAAHALCCSHRGRMIGGFGAAEVFSFHATKFVNSFEGGAVTTNDAELAKQLRLLRNFGFAGYDNVAALGTNAKMNEACAAMGLTSLEAAGEFIEANRKNFERYRDGLSPCAGVRLVGYDPSERSNFQYVVLEIDESRAGIGRDDLLAVLQAENVLARRYFTPGCHRNEPYRTLFPHAGRVLPVTERLAGQVLALPTGTSVSPKDVETICAVLQCVLHDAAAVRRRLREQTGAD